MPTPFVEEWVFYLAQEALDTHERTKEACTWVLTI